MMHGSSQLPILDIFFPGYRQAPTLSLLPLPSLSPGGSAPDLYSQPDTAPKLLHRQCICPTPNTQHLLPGEAPSAPTPRFEVSASSQLCSTAPKGWGAAGLQQHHHRQPFIPAPSPAPSSHHPQHHKQLHPLNLSKQGSQTWGAQGDPGHQDGNGDGPQAVCPPPERAQQGPGCRLLFFQLPAEVSWKGPRAQR